MIEWFILRWLKLINDWFNQVLNPLLAIRQIRQMVVKYN